MISLKKLKQSRLFKPKTFQEKLPQITLSEEQITEFKRVFSSFDKDGSGSIDASELGDAMRSLGQNPTKVELEEMIKEVDADKSGSIEFPEFMKMMKQQLQDADDEDDIFEALQVLTDSRKGDQVKASFLQKALLTTGEKLSQEDIDYLFKRIKVNVSGMIDCRELSQLLCQ